MEHLTEFRTALRHYVNFIMKQKVGRANESCGEEPGNQGRHSNELLLFLWGRAWEARWAQQRVAFVLVGKSLGSKVGTATSCFCSCGEEPGKQGGHSNKSLLFLWGRAWEARWAQQRVAFVLVGKSLGSKVGTATSCFCSCGEEPNKLNCRVFNSAL